MPFALTQKATTTGYKTKALILLALGDYIIIQSRGIMGNALAT